MISKRLLSGKHSIPITSRVIISYNHQSQPIATNATLKLFKNLSRMETIGILVVSFGPVSFFDTYFANSESIAISPWTLLKIHNTSLLKIVPSVPFTSLKHPSVLSASQNFATFSSFKTTEAFLASILSLHQSLKYSQTILFIENAHVLSEYYPVSQIEQMLCNIQYSHPEIYPLYLTLNNDVERSPAIAYTYKVTGTLNFKGYETLPGNSCKCRLEATMINSLKQYREELTQCVMKADGEIAIEEIKEIKEEKKEEPLTTFKIGMSEKEQEERKKIKGPYHTGVEEQFEGMKIEEEEDINDDEGENF